MTYRDDDEALREHLAGVEGRLTRLAQTHADERARLEAERDEIAGRLADRGHDPIDALRIASPCKAEWEHMKGDDHTRFCGLCQKNVYNLGGMTRAEATALIHEGEGSVCVRMYRRADGTVLTSDCPDGVRRKRRRLALVGAGAGALGAFAALSYASNAERSCATVGKMSVGETQGVAAVGSGATLPFATPPVTDPAADKDADPQGTGLRMGDAAPPRVRGTGPQPAGRHLMGVMPRRPRD